MALLSKLNALAHLLVAFGGFLIDGVSPVDDQVAQDEYGYPLYRLRVLFIRHGESQNNVLYGQSPELYRKNRFSDPDLTDRGIKQAEAAGKYLSSHVHGTLADFNPIMGEIDAIYVSPMFRTLRTAEPIANALNVNPRVWTDIYEVSGIHHGGYGLSGLSREEILDKFPNYILPNDITSGGWYPVDRNKESREMAVPRIVTVADRLYQMAADCYTNQKSRTIALVCHGDFKDMILQALLGLEIPIENKKRFLTYNTAISVVDLDAIPMAKQCEEEETVGEECTAEGGIEEKHATILLQNFVGHLTTTGGDQSLITLESLGKV